VIVKNVLKAALRGIKVIDPHVEPTAEMLANALEKLNLMLESWSLERINIYVDVKETITLTAAKYEYTWGTSGDISTTRPIKVISAMLRDSSSRDFSLNVITGGEYNLIHEKTTAGTPRKVFYRPEYTSSMGKLYVYPVPDDSTESIIAFSQKPWSSFSTLTEAVAFPTGYTEAIIQNLQIRLIGEYGKVLTQEMVGLASDSLFKVRTINFSNTIGSADFEDVPGLSSGPYNIETGLTC
jgi:protoheme ferro-lyase